VPPPALPPEPLDAILGTLSGEDFDRVAREAARTAPPRENGGNQDIKNFTEGTRVFYPVFVPGAKLSMGDLHFSQGDGEITFCGAIEMGGYIDLRVGLIKGGMETYGVSENVVFFPGNTAPQYSEWLAFSGLAVTRRANSATWTPSWRTNVPACTPSTTSPNSATPLSRSTSFWGPRRSKEGSPAWRTSPTPVRRCTSRQRSSTSTRVRRPVVRPRLIPVRERRRRASATGGGSAPRPLTILLGSHFQTVRTPGVRSTPGS
jgi:hypothetical protein